jgi:hypothetical protein
MFPWTYWSVAFCIKRSTNHPLQTSIYSPNKVQKVRYTNKNYGALWMLLNYILQRSIHEGR